VVLADRAVAGALLAELLVAAPTALPVRRFLATQT
jgi:hypothetical protein